MINKFTTTVRAINRNEDDKIRILSFSVHEGYQTELAKTGNQFVHVPSPEGKTWDEDYRDIPSNVIETDFDFFMEMDDVDVAISHTLRQRQFLSNICMNLNIPHICLMHCYPPENWPELTIAGCKEDNDVDINIFTTEDSKKQWGYENDVNSVVIEHGIDICHFKETEEEGVPPTVLTVANEYRKRGRELGFNLYQDIVSLFGDNAKDIFVHVGKSEDGSSSPAKNYDDLVKIYNSNGVFINTCNRSVLPTTMLEAMSCGVPVITTPNPAILNIINNGENGFIASSAEEFAEKIQFILSDISIRNNIGSAARKTVESRFSSCRMCKEWNDVLLKLLVN